MTTSFRKPYNVIKRNMGTWVEGVYVLDDDLGNVISVMATIQMPSMRDNALIEANPYGRRAGRHIKIYTDTRLQPVSQSINTGELSYPGDLIEYDGRTYLIFGEGDFTSLGRAIGSNIAHYRYYACEMIEGYALEGAP
jgi:hypothetical protein